MQKFLIQRLLISIPTVFLVTMLTFTILRVALPASVVDLILAEYGSNDAELRVELEKQLGLSASVPEQYARWVGLAWFWNGDTGLLQGDMGESLHSGRSVLSELKRRVLVSLELGIWAQFTAVMVSVPLGVWAAVKQDRLPDYGLRSLALVFNSVPGFWIAVVIITYGSIWFNWAPPINFKYFHEDPVAHLKIMLLPALIISLTPGAGLLRLVRTQMLEVLRQDYVRTAQAKGLRQSSVLYKHALRNALIPVVTVVGAGLPTILAGTVIFEQIFLLPGMGRYLVDAVNNLDYPVIEGLVVVFALVLVVALLIVDIGYALLDPRIRFR